MRDNGIRLKIRCENGLRRFFALITAAVISFSLFQVPAYAWPSGATYTEVTSYNFARYIAYYDNAGVIFSNDAIPMQKGNEDMISAMADLADEIMQANQYIYYYAKYSNGSERIYLKLFMPGETTERFMTLTDEIIQVSNSEAHNYHIQNNGVVLNSISYGFNVNFDPAATKTEQLLIAYGMEKYFVANDDIVDDLPTAVNYKRIEVPPGYGISFFRTSRNITGDVNNFSLWSVPGTTATGWISMAGYQYDRGIRYEVTNGFPSTGEKSILGLQKIWFQSIPGSTFQSIEKSYADVEIDASPGQAITIYNPRGFLYEPQWPMNNTKLTILYPANAYATRLFSIVTNDTTGYFPVAVDNTKYQPYDPLPSDADDDYVEFVDSEDPDYIDSSDPDYVEPDPYDPEYVAPPVITPTDPPSGGSLGGQPPGTYPEEEPGTFFGEIKEMITDFKNLIIGLFAPGVDAIQDLTSSGSGFMNTVKSMFTWLPSEVTAVISSGLILMVVIGVLKMLL